MNSILVRHKWEPYVWLLPSILLMTIFVVFPIGIVFKLAFSEISKAGIVGGSNGQYKPNDPIKRSEACVIFTRIAVASMRDSK